MKSDVVELSIAVAIGVVISVVAISSINREKQKPATTAFVPMELACVDAQGQAATKDTSLRYTHSGPTIVGVDEAGYTYLYTPPRGWVCRFGEIKKP